MNLRFEPDLDFQVQVVEAVCGLFRGQEICRTEFTVTRDRSDLQERLAFAGNDLGVGNRLTLFDDIQPNCVNQNGERLHGFELNTLTVVARESFEEFAENLQREIEKDTGIRFGVIKPHQFARIAVTGNGGEATSLGFDKSQLLYDHLKAKVHIDGSWRIQDSLREALRDDTLALPEEFVAQRAGISAVLRKLAGRLEVKNADERHTVRPRQAVLDSAEFKALGDRIKYKTTYRVSFDNEALLEESATALREVQPIPRTRLQWRKADMAIGQAGVEATEIEGSATVTLEETDIELPDLLTELQDRTQLTRRSIHISSTPCPGKPRSLRGCCQR